MRAGWAEHRTVGGVTPTSPLMSSYPEGRTMASVPTTGAALLLMILLGTSEVPELPEADTDATSLQGDQDDQDA